MIGHAFLAACLLAICLPIITVQLPRTTFYANFRSRYFAETRPSGAARSSPLPIQRRTRQKTTTSYDGADSGTASEDQAPQKSVRKPWDPPFPKKDANKGTKGEWLALPPDPPRKSGREMEEKGVATRLFPPDEDGDYEAGEPGEPDSKVTSHGEAPGNNSQPQAPRKAGSGGISVLWLMIGAMAVILFLLAFAILIAHCLAWFLVYMTEARLGEARRGLLKGGDMRLCLCAP